MRSWLIWLLLLTGFGQAQDFPVEVEMLGPPQRPPVRRPRWSPPPQLCKVCESVAAPRRCACYGLVTEALVGDILVLLREWSERFLDGRLRVTRSLTIRLVEQDKLDQMGGEPVLGLYEEGMIWISLALTRQEAMAVIAHEYGHAWHFDNNPAARRLSETIREGFADWVAYRFLQDQGAGPGAQRLRFQNLSPYGVGLRHLLEIEELGGSEAVLEEALGRS